MDYTTLTAKALRPIAADLRITGASRMKKDEIIAAIEAAEAKAAKLDDLTTPDFDEEAVYAQADGVRDAAQCADFGSFEQRKSWVAEPVCDHGHTQAEGCPEGPCYVKKMPYGGHWAMSYPLAPGGDGNVMQGHADYCATWGHATFTDNGVVASFCPRCGDVLAGDVVAERQAEEAVAREARDLAELIAEDTEASNRRYANSKPKFKAGDRFRVAPADGVWSVVELIDLDPAGGPGFAWTTKIIDDAKHLDLLAGRTLTLTEDFLSNDYVTPVEPTQAPEYFARPTRRGVETVVVERTHCGRVDYRIIDAKTGRRSAPYRMRETTFARAYTKLPA